MTEYKVSLDREGLEELLIGKDGLKSIVETIVNQVLETQMDEHIEAKRYERNGNRRGYRNGYKTRTIYARVGPLTLRVPQCRDGGFSTDIFSKYQRSEQALVLAMMEMVVQGVSTRKVAAITEELCGARFSKSLVSRLCAKLDARVHGWNNRSLRHTTYPFVVVDAMFIKVRKEEHVYSTAVLVASGINREGYREILGLSIGNSESEDTWRHFFMSLRNRGLSGVDLVVSDSHKGLEKSIRRTFQGAQWQRCQVHFMRNILGVTPRRHRATMLAAIQSVLYAPNKTSARRRFNELCNELGTWAKKPLERFESGLDDAITVLNMPTKYRRRLASTNMQERLNQEIRRRERVIRIFPNDESARRLIGALLAEKHDVWSTGKKYFKMDEYHQWKEDHLETINSTLNKNENVIQL